GVACSTVIAQWNGGTWSSLGLGMDHYVLALAVAGSGLYAGGGFTHAGGRAANYIAKWNGSSWSALGSGMNNLVYALAVSGSDLYAGGVFTTAGGKAADCVAESYGGRSTGFVCRSGDHVVLFVPFSFAVFAGQLFPAA